MKVQYLPLGRDDPEELDAAEPVYVIVGQDLRVTVTSEGIVVDRTDEEGNNIVESWHRTYEELFGEEEQDG